MGETSSDFEGILQNAINNEQFGNAVVESFREVKGLFWKSEEKRPYICLFVCFFFRLFNFFSINAYNYKNWQNTDDA